MCLSAINISQGGCSYMHSSNFITQCATCMQPLSVVELSVVIVNHYVCALVFTVMILCFYICNWASKNQSYQHFCYIKFKLIDASHELHSPRISWYIFYRARNHLSGKVYLVTYAIVIYFTITQTASLTHYCQSIYSSIVLCICSYMLTYIHTYKPQHE